MKSVLAMAEEYNLNLLAKGMVSREVDDVMGFL